MLNEEELANEDDDSDDTVNNIIHPAIDIYTDGSLNKLLTISNGAFIMGSGWIIPQLDIKYGCASTHWPSSTKAELIAIWTAILAIPIWITTINIFTDSQAAIDSINKAKTSLWNVRQYTKTPNSMIIEQILRLTRTKIQSLNLIKVKGHSGDLFNNLADDIAKQAASAGPRLLLR